MGNVGGGLYAYFVINADLEGEVDLGVSGSIPIVISSNISATRTLPPFTSNIDNAVVPIYSTIIVQTSNVYGAVNTPLPITGVVVGQYGATVTGSAALPITIAPAIVGDIPVTGTISRKVKIAISAVGEADAVNSLYGAIVISSQIKGFNTLYGAVSAPIPIAINAVGKFASQYGTIAASFNSTASARGFIAPAGSIGDPDGDTSNIVVTMQATIYLDQNSRLGAIYQDQINIIPAITGLVNNGVECYGSVDASLTIWTVLASSQVYVSPGGPIVAPVVISCFASQSNISTVVAKMNTNVVTYLPAPMWIVKMNSYAIPMQAPSVIAIAKSVAYAVIAPTVDQSQTAYQGFIFG